MFNIYIYIYWNWKGRSKIIEENILIKFSFKFLPRYLIISLEWTSESYSRPLYTFIVWLG